MTSNNLYPHYKPSAGPLDYDFNDSPSWRDADALSTSQMLNEVTETLESRQWTPEELDFLRGAFNKRQTVAFVFRSNQMEREGTQDVDSTQDLVYAAMGTDQNPNSLNEKQKVTVQTYKCMEEITRRVELLREQQPKTPHLALSTTLIKTLHTTLMTGLVANPGQFRTLEAYPFGREDFFYVRPDAIDASLESLLDAYNDVPCSADSLSVGQVAKLASWFLYHFLTIHPFSDGNGRLARILTNSILMMHVMYPVAIRPSALKDDSVETMRRTYIAAIEACRSDTAGELSHRPSDICAMLIESIWHSTRCLTTSISSRGNPSVLGPLILTSACATVPTLEIKISKWNSSCNCQLAAQEILTYVENYPGESNFEVPLSDGKTLQISNRLQKTQTAPQTPGSTVLKAVAFHIGARGK